MRGRYHEWNRFTNRIVPRTRDRYLLEEETGEGLTEADQSSQVLVQVGIAEAIRGSGYRFLCDDGQPFRNPVG
jgi:hypothetical protein